MQLHLKVAARYKQSGQYYPHIHPQYDRDHTFFGSALLVFKMLRKTIDRAEADVVEQKWRFIEAKRVRHIDDWSQKGGHRSATNVKTKWVCFATTRKQVKYTVLSAFIRGM